MYLDSFVIALSRFVLTSSSRDSNGQLTGFLNQPTQTEGLPLFIEQKQSIAGGVGQDPSVLRIADIDGDGKDDYVGLHFPAKLLIILILC